MPPKKKLPVRWTNSCRGRRRVWGHASKSICWRDRSTRLVFYLVSSSRFFLLLSMRLFLQKELKFQAVCFEGSYVRFDLYHRFWKCLFRRYCTIKISVIWSITKNKKKIELAFLVLRYFKFPYIYILMSIVMLFWIYPYMYVRSCL